MSKNEQDGQDDTKPFSEGRMVFAAVALIALVWVSVFIILPALTGKASVAQQMQEDLQSGNANGSMEK